MGGTGDSTGGFSFFSRPHPLLPPAATLMIPKDEFGERPGMSGDDELGGAYLPRFLLEEASDTPPSGGTPLLSPSSSPDLSFQSASLPLMFMGPPEAPVALRGAADSQVVNQLLGLGGHRGGGDGGGMDSEVEVIAPAANLRQILALPYSDERVSLAVHRVGGTLLIGAPPQPANSGETLGRSSDPPPRAGGDQGSTYEG
ncbi:hypothetical protein T484DRAFT_1893456, partial [Baffinella frigidus]